MDIKRTENASQGVPQVSYPHSRSTTPDTFGEVVSGDEIDLLKILMILWRGWRIIVATALALVLLGTIVAYRKHDIYRADTQVVTSKRKSGGANAGLITRLGGLAALAGIGIGGDEDTDTALNLVIMQSRPFAIDMVRKYTLIPIIFPPELRKPGTDEPTVENAADTLLGMIVIKKDDNGPLITISAKNRDPKRAFILDETLVKAINVYLKQQYLERAKRDVEAAQAALAKNPPLEVASSLFSVISEKTQQIVLVGAQDDYAFRVIEPAVVPGDPISPNRKLIIAEFFIVGLLMGIILTFLSHAFGKRI